MRFSPVLTPLSTKHLYSPSLAGDVAVIFRVLTLTLSPSFTSVMTTPLTPDTSLVESGSSQVMSGLGTPEAEQVKEAASVTTAERLLGS